MTTYVETGPTGYGPCVTLDMLRTDEGFRMRNAGGLRFWSFGTEVTRAEFDAIYPGYFDGHPRWTGTLEDGFEMLGQPVPTRETPGVPYPPGTRLRDRR